MSLAVYGLGKEVYACFNHFTAIETQTQILTSLRKLLVAWPDAAKLENDSKRVQYMQPLVYVDAVNNSDNNIL